MEKDLFGYLILAIVAACVITFLVNKLCKNEKKLEADADPEKDEGTGDAIDNILAFNEKFILANKALAAGDSDALRTGISLFIESLACAGEYRASIARAVSKLGGALSHHDRADTKGPWNRDLSGYGVLSWKYDLYTRDEALRMAWDDISQVNEQLKQKGLGWRY